MVVRDTLRWLHACHRLICTPNQADVRNRRPLLRVGVAEIPAICGSHRHSLVMTTVLARTCWLFCDVSARQEVTEEREKKKIRLALTQHCILETQFILFKPIAGQQMTSSKNTRKEAKVADSRADVTVSNAGF